MAKEKKFITCDGNEATARIAYLFSEAAAIYPITPSSPIAEHIDEWVAQGKKNLFGQKIRIVEMQSEAGAAGAVHGSLQAGVLTSTYTASQGLLLMIPNMYKMAGELLPAVFHVTARTIAAHALSIFGDHSDIYSARQTGFAFLASSSVQEAHDLASVAHLASLKGRVPFCHFFDGFRTSHEIQKIEALSEEDLLPLLDTEALQQFRSGALNPEHPVIRGTAQNPDVFFQAREASNKFYDVLPDTVNNYMQEIARLTGREYKPFTYYGAEDAENIIIAMGSVTETIRETVDYLNAKGEKLGVVTVHLYRPFSVKYLSEVIPQTVKRICVLDRTKEAGANGDPLYLDVVEAFASRSDIPCEKKPLIIGGRYGLSSKDTTPAQIISVFNNLSQKEPKNQFTVGIVDDVTFRSLPLLPEISVSKGGLFEGKFYGLGADGTVGANKNSIKIIGETTDKYCQAYFAYDSKKSGGFTCSHLRFGNKPILMPYLVTTPDFVACHVAPYVFKYDMLKGVKDGGTFLLNSWWNAEETKKQLPLAMKRYMAEHKIKFYIINATKIAEEIGLGNRTNTILQSAFFKISGVIPYDIAVKEMKKFIDKSYGNKGENIVSMNYAAVDRGGEYEEIVIPAEWANLTEETSDACQANTVCDCDKPDFIKNVVDVINNQAGDDLPVSTFVGREDGTFPVGTSQYEKRGIASHIPMWISEKCIQCNQCAYVCPHAAIRPFLMDEKEVAGIPVETPVIKATGKEFEGMQYRMQVSSLDCTGCGSCVEVCPAKEKALEMAPFVTPCKNAVRWNYMSKNVKSKQYLVEIDKNVKNSQFATPLFEFSGACAGCGETPYIKLITQLYGDRMMVANATGCSSIYGGSCPSMPYCTNEKGQGPAWANSLFEDNAEYGLGMALGLNTMRDKLASLMTQGLECPECSAELKELFKAWLENRDNAVKTQEIAAALKPLAEACSCDTCKEILALEQYLVKKSIWIFGGDGWGYDIGYGGLDHVIASGENVNILVMDTEVYSNTGGQASKATPTGAIAKFAASGKKIRKKDLGAIAMTYGYVYVAQVAMGASQVQYLKAVKEAEAYDGPSLIIAYAPCISHGLKVGMGRTQDEMKRAVECGYWQLWRYNPALETAGQNPFMLDSKEPDWSKFREFILGEVRYNALTKMYPEQAEELFKAAEENAKWRYKSYLARS
ncbi:MAG: pyruvate:ferredoxin (flavodoxin) oxidoreductase [Bacteroidales bacterium]|jgi:pyruvate-ferredoxin/flavodoxin oxidoreductase|nr:pyruvate:ferredoxin (flavodoxin) oxidoreductase [Bacteroidales bacterium]